MENYPKWKRKPKKERWHPCSIINSTEAYNNGRKKKSTPPHPKTMHFWGAFSSDSSDSSRWSSSWFDATELRVATFPHIGTREHALSLGQPFSVAILDPQKGGFCEPTKNKRLFGLHVTSVFQLSYEKNPYYFPWNTGWLIRILIMVYYNPYIAG